MIKNTDSTWTKTPAAMLPKQRYANRIGYTDVEPYEVIETGKPKLLLIRRMKCTETQASMDYRAANTHIGGFCAHVAQQHRQSWYINSDINAPVEKIRLHKDGTWRNAGGTHFQIEDRPRKFYDFNF